MDDKDIDHVFAQILVGLNLYHPNEIHNQASRSKLLKVDGDKIYEYRNKVEANDNKNHSSPLFIGIVRWDFMKSFNSFSFFCPLNCVG